MHAERDRYVGSFAERRMLCCVVALTEVVTTVPIVKVTDDETKNDIRETKKVTRDSQVPHDDVHRCRWVIGRDRDVATGFVAVLGELSYRVPFHWQIGPGNLDEGGCHD